ncbi:MAG: deoxyribose-phosphate aldolase [Armatimonadetes bacterium CG07_land_8_20_14_0_80_40_9]|nr:MAG: deoxyribose-phosphate aldolase [Armatimonadetes bacterium CG07_land_8_20_14_0_80_40_9]
MEISKEELAKMIDQSKFSPQATREEIRDFCQEAKRYNFNCLFVNPAFTAYAVKLLRGTPIKVGAPIGFPLGATLPEVKAYEAKSALENGAKELDMVINIGALRSADYLLIEEEIRLIVRLAAGKVVKVILETCFLSKNEIVKACELAKEVGADFVKTSTGFGPGGAEVEDVKLLRKCVGKEMGVKAAGGIRTFSEAMKFIKAGANRIGTSSGVAIVKGYK